MTTGAELGLSLLVLLSLHCSAAQHADVLIFCDDPTVDKAVTSAINRFNQEVFTGNKLALFQVTFASKVENGSYHLKFTTRRSDCASSDIRPWSDCDYLPIDRKPFPCNATVHVNETHADTEHVECQLEELATAGRAQCLGCPEDIDENSEDLKAPLSLSISKYNIQSEHTHHFTLNEVGPATRQVVAGFRYKFQFDLRRSNCAKAEHKELHELCVADPENVEYSNCNSTVDMAPWRQETPNVNIECEPGAMPPVVFTRRRPPGWSPLRTLLPERPDAAPALPAPPPTAPQPATQAPKEKKKGGSGKEESSEEDTSLAASPFHCPSQTWKPFVPVPDAAPTPAPANPVEGTFSNLDLLG